MTKRVVIVLAATLVASASTFVLTGFASATSAMAHAGDSVAVAVYEGRTPCGPIANEFTRFPSEGCEKIKWQLTFFRDAQTRQPSAFLYEGTRGARRGTWTIHRGTPFDAAAQGYRLTPTPEGKPLSLLNVDDKALLLLDESLRVLAGDASWSYVLNRTDRKLSK